MRGVVRQKKEPRYIMVEVVEVKDDGDVVVQHKSTALNMLGNGGLQTVSRADIKEDKAYRFFKKCVSAIRHAHLEVSLRLLRPLTPTPSRDPKQTGSI